MTSNNPSAAPLTVTLPPNLAASVRFLAHVYGHSPEEQVLHILTEPISCVLQGAVFDKQDQWAKWLFPAAPADADVMGHEPGAELPIAPTPDAAVAPQEIAVAEALAARRPIPKAPMTIELDQEQLAILMSGIESRFDLASDGPQSVDALARAVEFAAETWGPGQNNSFAYEVVRVAPVYRQLLAHRTEPGRIGGVWDTDDPAEFASHLAEARAAVSG